MQQALYRDYYSKTVKGKLSWSSIVHEFSDDRQPINVKQYLSHRYTSEKLKNIGEWFGVSESALSHAVRRVAKTIVKDKNYEKINNLGGKLSLSRFKA